jgi:hypothetical protein
MIAGSLRDATSRRLGSDEPGVEEPAPAGDDTPGRDEWGPTPGGVAAGVAGNDRDRALRATPSGCILSMRLFPGVFVAALLDPALMAEIPPG